jgi:hypothetical protein
MALLEAGEWNSRLESRWLIVHLRGRRVSPPAQAGIAALAFKARLRVAGL